MHRVRLQLRIFMVLVALLLAGQPLLHNHSLDGGSDATTRSAPSACAVCAAGIGRLPSTAPLLAAPHSVLYTLAAAPSAPAITAAQFPRSSRAPPVS